MLIAWQTVSVVWRFGRKHFTRGFLISDKSHHQRSLARPQAPGRATTAAAAWSRRRPLQNIEHAQIVRTNHDVFKRRERRELSGRAEPAPEGNGPELQTLENRPAALDARVGGAEANPALSDGRREWYRKRPPNTGDEVMKVGQGRVMVNRGLAVERESCHRGIIRLWSSLSMRNAG
jgi:hypothetical protein